jgi:hypothetical protein
MRDTQQLQRAVVRKDALGLDDRRHKDRIQQEPIDGRSRWNDSIDSPAHGLQPAGFEIVFEPVESTGAPTVLRPSFLGSPAIPFNLPGFI